METHFFKQISLLYHYLFIIMGNQKKCSNSIKNENDNSVSISSNRF